MMMRVEVENFGERLLLLIVGIAIGLTVLTFGFSIANIDGGIVSFAHDVRYLVENESVSDTLNAYHNLGMTRNCVFVAVLNGSSSRLVSNVLFNFSSSDTSYNIDSCVLWGNWSGVWAANESVDVSKRSVVGNFSVWLPIHNKAYSWNVYCNNTLGYGGFAGSNRTVLVTQGVLA